MAARFAWILGVSFTGVPVLATGCVRDCACEAPRTFGGEGAQVAASEVHPLTAERPGPQVTGACATAPAPSEAELLEDFEDGNNQLFKAYNREGWWFTATDGTEDGEVLPPKSGFSPSPLSPELSRDHDEMAAHFVAPQMNDWGVSWGTTLRWVQEGVSCPLNASGFEGIEFWAQGPATITVKLGTSFTVPPEYGGVCETDCWDMHFLVVRIKEGWNRYVVPWNKLQQGGWGTDARFDPTRLLTINWTAGPSELPVDFWLDDVRFWTAELEERRAAEPKKVPVPRTDSAQELSSAPGSQEPTAQVTQE